MILALDTTHEYADTVKELDAWVPKLRRDGAARLWAHDYLGDYVGCRQAIDEAIASGLVSISVPPGRGLGIVLASNLRLWLA